MQSGQRMLAVVFADISGSTALYEALGDAQAHRVVESCLQTLRNIVAEFEGRVVKAIGDELLCVFNDAQAAIGVASEMQFRLDAQRRADSSVPAIRVGISHGPVLEDAGDVFGDTVNLAARVAALANPAQVLTTRQTVDALPPLLRAACRPLYAIDVKGIAGKVSIYDVVWKLDADLTLVSGSLHDVVLTSSRALRLSYRGQDVSIGPEQRDLRVGRDPQNDLVVTARAASRRHARVRLYEGNFVLIDESANGTYVRFDAQPELHLRREETVLVGHGLIGLGESTSAEGAEPVIFAVQ